MILPDCMMPDGADPCEGFKQLAAERDRYRQGFDEVSRSHQATLARVAELETALEGVREHAALMDAENRALALKCWRLENPE